MPPKFSYAITLLYLACCLYQLQTEHECHGYFSSLESGIWWIIWLMKNRLDSFSSRSLAIPMFSTLGARGVSGICWRWKGVSPLSSSVLSTFFLCMKLTGWASPLTELNFPTKQSIKVPLGFWQVEILVFRTGTNALLKGKGGVKCLRFRTPYEVIVHRLETKIWKKIHQQFFISYLIVAVNNSLVHNCSLYSDRRYMFYLINTGMIL